MERVASGQACTVRPLTACSRTVPTSSDDIRRGTGNWGKLSNTKLPFSTHVRLASLPPPMIAAGRPLRVAVRMPAKPGVRVVSRRSIKFIMFLLPPVCWSECKKIVGVAFCKVKTLQVRVLLESNLHARSNATCQWLSSVAPFHRASVRGDKTDGIAAEKGHPVAKNPNCRGIQGSQLMIRDRYDTRGGNFYGHAPREVKHAYISHASGEPKNGSIAFEYDGLVLGAQYGTHDVQTQCNMPQPSRRSSKKLHSLLTPD